MIKNELVMNPDMNLFTLRRLLLPILSGLLLFSCQPSASDAGKDSATVKKTNPLPPVQNRPIRDLIQIEDPTIDEAISSPVTIRGQARGYWFFEGDFPVQVQDEEGHLIAQGTAQARGEWMTEEWVPFEAVVSFKRLDHNRGYLYFEMANPSKLKEYEKSFRMPVVFAK